MPDLWTHLVIWIIVLTLLAILGTVVTFTLGT